MSDDERGSDFEASDEEGENQIVHQFDDDDDDTEIEDNEDDDDQTREEKLKMRLSKMIWSDKMEQLKKRNKDKVLSKKVLFKPTNVIDCFGRFMPTKLKEKIRQYSNMKGKEVVGDDFKEIQMEELEAFFGVMIAGGLTHQTRTSFDTLWEEETPFIPMFFKAVMSRDRAREIRRFLRFDDKKERTKRLGDDKLAAVREINDIIVEQFKSSYRPNATLTVDERISPFRGRVGFRIYMKSKPKKYGIKFWVLCDAVNSYVLNFKIYSGKDGNKREKNQGENVVMDLTSHLEGGYQITTDNFFTSIRLALKLLMRSKNPMTLLGTIKASRLHIPPAIKNFPKNEEYSSKFFFNNDMMLVNYIPKAKKSVVLLSSSHPTNEIMDGEKKKPKIIDDYNHTKYGVDKLDEMTQSISCIRSTRRWTVNVFSNMLDMVCFNSFICYRETVDRNIKRKDFMMQLCLDLCKTNVKNRLSIFNLPAVVKSSIFKLYPDLKPAGVITEHRPKPTRGARCDLCTGPSKDKKFATQFCSFCVKKVCTKHQQATKCTE